MKGTVGVIAGAVGVVIVGAVVALSLTTDNSSSSVMLTSSERMAFHADKAQEYFANADKATAGADKVSWKRKATSQSVLSQREILQSELSELDAQAEEISALLDEAKQNVKQYQDDYTSAVTQFGEGSAQARQARQDLDTATDQMGKAQMRADADLEQVRMARSAAKEYYSAQVESLQKQLREYAQEQGVG